MYTTDLVDFSDIYIYIYIYIYILFIYFSFFLENVLALQTP